MPAPSTWSTIVQGNFLVKVMGQDTCELQLALHLTAACSIPQWGTAYAEIKDLTFFKALSRSEYSQRHAAVTTQVTQGILLACPSNVVKAVLQSQTDHDVCPNAKQHGVFSIVKVVMQSQSHDVCPNANSTLYVPFLKS